MLPKTLMIGCGKKQIKYLKIRCCVAIDISKEALEECKKIRPENEYIKADVIKMPFKNNYFEKVIFTGVLEYVDNAKKALSEIRRVMQEDGELILTVPVGRTSDFLGKKFPIYERDVIRGHHKYLFTEELLEELLKEFKEININEKDKFSTAYWYIWSIIYKRFFKDLKINKEGKILSKNYPRLTMFIDKIVVFLSFIGEIFVGKGYYKTYYVKAVK